MFKSCLTIKDAKDLFKAIAPEQNDFKSKRANVTFEFTGDNLTINIFADDFTAFRAMESALMRLLVTYYKIEQIEV